MFLSNTFQAVIKNLLKAKVEVEKLPPLVCGE
jgi:hypothetical protein